MMGFMSLKWTFIDQTSILWSATTTTATITKHLKFDFFLSLPKKSLCRGRSWVYLYIHTQVKWVPDNLDNYLNFYSVSGDGRVTNWTLIKCGLWFNDKLAINFNKMLNNMARDMVEGHLMGNFKQKWILFLNRHSYWPHLRNPYDAFICIKNKHN